MKITPPLGELASALAGVEATVGGISTGYDGSGSGSSSDTLQAAIDELFAAILNFVTKNRGGQETVVPHGSMGASETIDLADGNYHYGTLDADCTFSFTGTGTGAAGFTLELTEDGSGGHTPSWPGSVSWGGGSAPTHDTTAGTTTLYSFVSRDGGTSWFGFQAGGGSTTPTVSSGFVPTYIGPAETLTIPDNRQALYAVPIVCDGMIDIGTNSYLVEVA